MSKFWEIKIKNYHETALELKNHIPELNMCSIDDIVLCLRGSGLFVIKKQQITYPIWIRFTLPFAFIFLILLIISLPFKFMFTGNWNYRVQWINNWFYALGFYHH